MLVTSIFFFFHMFSKSFFLQCVKSCHSVVKGLGNFTFANWIVKCIILMIVMEVDRGAAGAAFGAPIHSVGTACRTNRIRG